MSKNIEINFDAADRISAGIREVHSVATNIHNSAKKIDTSAFASYSPKTVSSTAEFASKISEVVESIDDLASSYNGSIQLYKDALQEIEASVKDQVEETPTQTETAPGEKPPTVIQTENGTSINTVTETEEKPKTGNNPINNTQNTSNTTPVVIHTINETVHEEIKQTISFYFNYPKASKTMSKVSDSKLRDLLTKNGATKVKDNVYQLKIDGKTYQYNVSTGEVIIPGTGGEKLRCRFYASKDTDFTSIKNTITFMGGSGERNDVPDQALNMSINKNSLIILPICNSPLRATDKIGGATRIGDFMAGGKTKTITNSVSGYSLGGLASFGAVADNPGLYQKVVTVNSGAFYSSGGGKIIDGRESAFKDVEIIMLEGANDKFVDSTIKTIKTLKNAGVPMKNISIYTNDKKLINNAKKYLNNSNIHIISDSYAKSHRGWNGHSYGYDMLNDLNVFSYLSA